MATVAESSPGERPNSTQPFDLPLVIKSKALEEYGQWIDDALRQAFAYKKITEERVDAAIKSSRSRLSEITSTGSAHFQQTIESLRDVKSEYEDLLFGKIKEGINLAASHPFITSGVTIGLGSLVLKRPRRFLYYNTLRLFMSEESMLSQADARVKELQQLINLMKAESEKLEKRASFAEAELIRGRTKLRQAGKQIQNVIHSACKIERQAAGLKDILQELPSREASRFRSQVSSLASEARQEKKALTKEVAKITNYGISI